MLTTNLVDSNVRRRSENHCRTFPVGNHFFFVMLFSKNKMPHRVRISLSCMFRPISIWIAKLCYAVRVFVAIRKLVGLCWMELDLDEVGLDYIGCLY